MLVTEVADSDISKFIEFQNVNRGDVAAGDVLYAVEATWDIVPEGAAVTLYYYHQRRLFGLFGTHFELSREAGEAEFSLNVDLYVTDEDEHTD